MNTTERRRQCSVCGSTWTQVPEHPDLAESQNRGMAGYHRLATTPYWGYVDDLLPYGVAGYAVQSCDSDGYWSCCGSPI